MANSYFQFKHFRIEQGDCAMKVCTDACVLGASANLRPATRLLDIGTGTGLLALIAAQRNPEGHIEAIEIDSVAAGQANANVAASPWADRVRVHGLSLQQYRATQPAPFDHILCNPPFFRSSLRSPNAARTTARHAASDTLSFEEIVEFAAHYLTVAGQMTVLLPPPEMQQFEQIAALGGIFAHSRLCLHHRAGSRATRYITTFGRQVSSVQEDSLYIYAADSQYTEEFQALLRDFYLAF
ncbi:tRNA1(Val) (adenine(37)-N6)-methyltransferase [Hymenobacter sp. HD11105]